MEIGDIISCVCNDEGYYALTEGAFYKVHDVAGAIITVVDDTGHKVRLWEWHFEYVKIKKPYITYKGVDMEIGDKVKCIDYRSTGSGISGGTYYEVLDVHHSIGYIEIKNDYGVLKTCHASRFEAENQSRTGWQQMKDLVKEKPKCDCGSKYAFGNVHSDWCSIKGEV